MKRTTFFLLLIGVVFPFLVTAQTIVKGTGIVYTNGVPAHTVNVNTDAEVGIDTAAGLWYEWNRDSVKWQKAGYRIQKIGISVAPSWVPTDKESIVVLNDVDSLYAYRGGVWRHLNRQGDPSSTNEGLLGVGAGSGTSSVITSNTSGAVGVTINVAGINTISETTSANGGQITITATEVDGSISNELQTIANTSNATSHTVTLSNSGGSVQLVEGGIVTLTTTGTGSAGVVTISATEVDGSTSNELQTYAHSGTTSYTNTLSAGGGSFTLNGAGITTISQTAGTVTITSTEVDGSVTNELQTIANTSDGTSHTVTLSNSGGTVQLVEGANITLTTTGTSGAGIVTIASSGGGGATDLTFSGASSPVTLNSSTGTDVTFTAGGINTFSASGTNITITATEVDGSTSNELQTYAHSGTTSYTNTLSSGGGSFTLNGAGITTISQTAGTVTITSTEVDGSVSNELQTIANTSDGTSHTVTLSNSGGTVQLVEGANITLTTTGTSGAGIVTIASNEVDGSITNEGLLGVGAGSGTSSVILSNTSTAVGVTINVAGINTISESTSANGGSITITATEVDGSVSNELQTIANTSDATSHTVTLSNAGGTVQFVEGGIVTLTTTGTSGAGIVTVSATEVDGSVSNELQTIANTSDGTSHTVTLSNSGGTVQLVEGSGITLTTTGTSGAGIVTIAATGGGASNYQLLRDDGVDQTQRANANFVSSGDIVFTLTDDGANNETEIVSDIPAQGVDFSEIQNVSTGTVAGRSTAGTGSLEQITVSTGLTISGGTITANDPSTTNEAWTIDADDADTEVISNQTVKFQGSGIVVTDYVPGTDILTITGTEVDGSTSNELQTYAHSGTTSYTNTLSAGGGSFTLNGAGITTISQTAGTVTITSTEVDGSVTNEGTLGVGSGSGTSSVILSNTSGATGVTINVAGINTISESTSANGGSITITATEVDGSTTNEAWTIDADDADTEVISNQTVKFQGGGIVVTDYVPGTDILTITGTEVDGSVSNELQTIANTSDGTSHTVTLSNSGGTVQLVEGSNITLTTTGTSGAGIVTIASTEVDGSVTNEGTLGVGAGVASSSVILSNTSGATGVTINVAGINTISETTSANGGQITITGTEVDGSTSNELQTYAHSGTTSYTNTLSNGGGSFTLNGAGITTISQTAGTVTITSTEVDGSVSNELQTIANTSNATSHTVTLSNSGGSVQLVEGGIVTLTTTGTSGAGIVTVSATEVDGSISNEGSLTVGAGGVNTSIINSNTSGSTGVTIEALGIIEVNETGNTIQIEATEVDGSVSNELQTIANTSDATSHTVTLSNSGGTVQLVEGSGITLTTTGTSGAGIVTIAATGGGGTNLYNSNGTLNSLNRVATIGHRQLTWVATDSIGGKIPFRILSTGNEPEFQVWKGNTDSVYIKQSDAEYILKATAGFDINSDQILSFTADSIVYSGTTVGTDNGLATITGLNSVNTSKKLAGTVSGQVVKWNGTEWVAGTDNGGNLPAGSDQWTVRYSGTTLVATNEILNNGNEVGIGGSPVATFELYVNGATRSDGALVSRGTGTTPQSSLTTPQARLWNTSAGGDIWYLGSLDNGNFVIESQDLGFAQLTIDNTGLVSTLGRLAVGGTGGTATSLTGRDGSNIITNVTVGSGLSLTGGTLSASGGSSPVVIRPASIGSHQNDYSPTDWATANIVFLTSSANYQITGFSATGVSDGEVKTLHNIGTHLIYFPIENTGSTAANRITGNSSYFLFAGKHVDVIYDATNSRWRFLDGFQPEDVTGPYYDARAGSSTAADFGDLAFTLSGGTTGTSNASTTALGAWSVGTSTSATGFSAVTLGKTVQPNFSITGNKPQSFEGVITTEATLSDGAQTYWIFMRFTNVVTATATANNQYGFRYNHTQNTGKWELYLINNAGTLTTFDSGITVAANTRYKLRVDVDATGTVFNGYINDAYIGQLTPVTSPTTTGHIQAGIVKTLGVTARTASINSLTGYQHY